jgi:transposase
MTGFREPELARDQMVLFATMLDDAIPESHGVRVFAEILCSAPFVKAFEKMARGYHLDDGRPPFHPKTLGGLWLYGMANRIRSSRQLEMACHNRIDFRWLMEGQTPDHATICGFVKRHKKDLKELLKATLSVAIQADLLKVRHLAVDGSKVEANASNRSMKKQGALNANLKQVESAIEKLTKEWEENEQQEAGLGEAPWTPKRAGLSRQREKVRAALAALDRRESEHAKAGARRSPAPVASTSDPDARQMRDKEDRSKPNYTTQVGVDAESGLVTSEDVTDAPWDGGGLLPMIEQTQKNTGMTPEDVSADSAYNTGQALTDIEAKGIRAYMPDCGASGPSSEERNRALADAREGKELTNEQQSLIIDPRTGRISREAFRHEPARDVYVCPKNEELVRVRTTADANISGTAERTQYVASAAACANCSLKTICVAPSAARRMVTCDQFEPERERLRARMATAEGRLAYKKRTVTERTFGWLKVVGGLRKFLRRGFDDVRAEFTLTCTALNMRILATKLQAASKSG